MKDKDKLAVMDSVIVLINRARKLLQHTNETNLLIEIVEESAKISKIVGKY
jgi:hypothetical protein